MKMNKEQILYAIKNRDVLTLSSNQTKLDTHWFKWVTNIALANPTATMDSPLEAYISLTDARHDNDSPYAEIEKINSVANDFEEELNNGMVEIENILKPTWLACTNQGHDIFVIHHLETDDFILIQSDFDGGEYDMPNFFNIRQAWFAPVLSYKEI